MPAAKILHKKIIVASAFLITSLVCLISFGSTASALSASQFDRGRIIDDGVFFRGWDMNSSQIQQFLNAKVPVCDTNGTQPHNGTTAGAYGAARGNPPPYTCLKDFRENTPTRSPSPGLCDGYTGGNHSAADIIYNVGTSCGVSPKALIVLLQKEQGLVTDDWPWPRQYRSATGYGCPDTAPCDSEYYGFFNQVYNAAKQFKRYAKDSHLFNYKALRNNTIQYNPLTSCGSSSVYIQNQATAGLYNYTPYQPNPAALSGLSDSSPGGGDGCSAYGNRNFWWYFNRWFGSTTVFNGSIILNSPLTVSHPNPLYPGNTVTASYTVKNNASYSVYVGGLGICGKLNGSYYDFGFTHHVTIPADGTTTISFSKAVDSPGPLYLFICSYNDYLGGWASDAYPSTGSDAHARTKLLHVSHNPLVTSGVTFSTTSPSIGQAVTATMTIKNYSTLAITLPTVVVAARDPYGNNVDFPAETNLAIPANSTVTYSKSRTFTSPGSHSFFVTGTHWGVWNSDFPRSVDGNVVRRGTLQVQHNPLITTGVSFSPTNPAIGQTTTATFQIRNASASPVSIPFLVLAARDPNGGNADFGSVSDLTIAANTTYTYSKSRTLSVPGTHSFFISTWGSGGWSNSYPKSADGSIIRSGNLSVKDNPLVTAGIGLSPSGPTSGQSVTATVQIRNDSSSAVTLTSFVVAARNSSGGNVDFPADQNVSIPANSTYSYSEARSFTSGNYTLFIAALKDGVWRTNYPKSVDGTIVRQLSLTVP